MLQARGPYRKKYDPAKLREAVEKIGCGELSYRAAEARYGIPKATLADRVKGRINVETCKSGPSSVLTAQEENLLQAHIVSCSRVGYPLAKSDIKKVVQKLLNEDGRVNPFKENLPGIMIVA